MRSYTAVHLARIYPAGYRVDSSNYDPQVLPLQMCCGCHGGNELIIFLIYFSVILVLFPERLEEWDDHWCITCSLKTCENQQHGDEMTWHGVVHFYGKGKRSIEIYRNLTLFSLTSAVVVLFMMTLTLLCARQDGWEAGCQMVALNGQKSRLEWKSDPGICGIPNIYIYIYNYMGFYKII